MPREYRQYLEDILLCIARIEEYTKGQSQADFVNDFKTQDAVLHNLEIIGEAVKAIPEDFRTKYPQVEWSKIIGLRDIIAHRYFGVDFEIIWDVVRTKLIDLEKSIKSMLEAR